MARIIFVSAEDEGGEGCDVIVDDVSQSFEPGFRDGIISAAVDEVVAGGSLYFSSAGNSRNGYKFTSVSLLLRTRCLPLKVVFIRFTLHVKLAFSSFILRV